MSVFGESDAPPMLDQAAAVAQTKKALRLVRGGQLEEGCRLFQSAFELWPHPSNAVNVARCHERFGRFASAWAYYYRTLALNRQTTDPQERRQRAEKVEAAIAALEPRLPRVELKLMGIQPPTGFVITHAGKEYPEEVLGRALPIDPGEGAITASAPGYVDDRKRVVFVEGETTTVEFFLRPVPKVQPPPAMVEEKQVPTWIWITAGLGVASAAASAALFVDMGDAIDDVDAQCESDSRCPGATDVASLQDDEARANRSLGLGVGFGVAAVGLVSATLVGVVVGETVMVPRTGLWATPTANPWGGGLTLGGRF